MIEYSTHLTLHFIISSLIIGGRAGPAAAGLILFESPELSAKEAPVCSTAQYNKQYNLCINLAPPITHFQLILVRSNLLSSNYS